MIIKVGPTGHLITGTVLDVGMGPFEQALKDHDSQLYVKWNPYKLYGWGCYEIRRRPNEKAVVDAVKIGNMTISRLEYCENDLIHHVLDCAFLNYDQIRKIKTMDTAGTQQQYFVDKMEAREAAHVQKKRETAKADAVYHAKQYKKEMKDLKEFVASGNSLGQVISQNWGK